MAGRVKVDNAMLHWHWHTLYSTAAVGIEMQEGLLLATYPNEHCSPVDRVSEPLETSCSNAVGF